MREKIKNWLKSNWFKIIAVAFLLGALANNPYSYYQLLRWVILIIAAYSAYVAYSSKKIGWALVFGAITILFNPIIPFYFSRNNWQIMDVVVAILFFISLFTKYEKV